MTLGILFLLIGLPLYVYIIREKPAIGQISDPVVVAFLLVIAGVWTVTEATIGPEITSLEDFWFFVTSKKLWFIVVLPTILLSMTAVFIGRWLRHKKHGKPEKKPRRISWRRITKKLKMKLNKGGVSMNYEERATEYAEKFGIIEYEREGNLMGYKEVFPLEGSTFLVHVDLDTMTERRRVIDDSDSQKSSPISLPEDRKRELYDYLKGQSLVTCDFKTFQKGVSVFMTPHGVYTDKSMSVIERDRCVNQLLNVTPDELNGYKNAVDWLVQQDKNVHYVQPLDLYIQVLTDEVTFTTNEESA